MFEWLRNVFVNEEIKQFKNKSDGLTDKQAEKQSGEGLEVLGIDSGYTDISSFNLFYNSKLNQTFKNNRDRYKNYRSMATMPEIIDIIEDAVNESTQEDDDGNILNLKIVNEKIENSENINKVLYHEFDELFNKTLDINTELWRYAWNFMVDGCIYYERIINISNAKQGIKGIKLLPPESMDYIFNYQTNKVEAFLQYIQERTKRPSSIEEARKDKNVVVFIPEQIGFIPYRFGKNKNEIIGFLENCKVAYNQLKLLEAAVIVYRLVRAPERFVFKIDVGNMPKDKALRYVNKIKQQMNRKQTYDPNTGTMDGTVNVQSVLDNIYIPQSDNRGSDVETIGGDSAGFTELDDVKYFAKKLFRALKYPMSRVDNMLDNRNSDVLFQGSNFAEIARDEIKWSKFLERMVQNKFSAELKDLFLLHLKFKGLKNQYNLNRNDIAVSFNPPSEYREQMKQQMLEVKLNNYSSLSNEEAFSKSYLMKKYLGMDEEEIKENSKGFDEDKKLFPQDDRGF